MVAYPELPKIRFFVRHGPADHNKELEIIRRAGRLTPGLPPFPEDENVHLTETGRLLAENYAESISRRLLKISPREYNLPLTTVTIDSGTDLRQIETMEPIYEHLVKAELLVVRLRPDRRLREQEQGFYQIHFFQEDERLIQEYLQRQEEIRTSAYARLEEPPVMKITDAIKRMAEKKQIDLNDRVRVQGEALIPDVQKRVLSYYEDSEETKLKPDISIVGTSVGVILAAIDDFDSIVAALTVDKIQHLDEFMFSFDELMDEWKLRRIYRLNN